jgi:hypothetical protein
MKRFTAVAAAMVLVVSMVSMVFAASMQKGVIKSVDVKAGTVVFSAQGSTADVTLKADKGVDLTKIKAGDKVQASIENDVIMQVKSAMEAKPKAPVGC